MNERSLAWLAAAVASVTFLLLVVSIAVDHRRRRSLEELNRKQARMLNDQEDVLVAVRLAVQGVDDEDGAASSEFRSGYLACAKAVLRELDRHEREVPSI